MLKNMIKCTILAMLNLYYYCIVSRYSVTKCGNNFILTNNREPIVMAVSPAFVVVHQQAYSKNITTTKFFKRIVDDRQMGDGFFIEDVPFNVLGGLHNYLTLKYSTCTESVNEYDDLFELGNIALETPYDRVAPWLY